MILVVPGVHNFASDLGEPWHRVSCLQPKIILNPRVEKYSKFPGCTRCPVILEVPGVHNFAGDLGEPWY